MLSDGASRLHRATRHGSAVDAADRLQLVAFRPLDPGNRPAPFKRYVGREAVPLTRKFGLSGTRAADVLSGRSLGVVDTRWDGERLHLEKRNSASPSRAEDSATNTTRRGR